MTQGDAHPETRRMMETAIRRLNTLEYLVLAVAVGLALLAGALAAWMAESLMGASFRLACALSSLLSPVVPGWTVFRRERRTRARYGAAIDGEAGAVRADSEDIT
ncbi:MAG: hypothetical protein VYA70_10340 [Gemmatimonadota bacterium]|nr:hypothetical protein [Gemmatimonadota bacterium]